MRTNRARSNVFSPPLDVFGLFLIHFRDFISRIAKRVQNFIKFGMNCLRVAVLYTRL